MSNPVNQYLLEVLGFKWLPLRSEESAPSVLVVTPAITPVEIALLRKMMAAIGVERYEVSDALKPGAGVALILDGVNPGECGEQDGRRTIHSLALADLSAGADVQSNKRLAWGHLRQIQSWLQENAR